jgi:hypothetical protein
LNFVDTTTDPISFYTSATLKADATASQFESVVNGFYSSAWGCKATVNREMFDTTGAVTTNQTLATSMRYTITVLKQMATFSTSGVQALPAADKDKGTNATSARLTVTPPMRGQ